MILASPKSWRSKAAVTKLSRRFLAIFGGFWLFLQPLALWRPDDLHWGFKGYVALVVLSFFGAVLWAWPKNSITRRLPVSDTKIRIKIGDLLEQQGNIIIGVSDVFDTEIGDIIAPSSIQGQFQAKVFPERQDLDYAITQALTGVDHEVDQAKPRGKL